MDKNVFLAFFLSALVIILYYVVFPPQAPKPQSPDPVARSGGAVESATDSPGMASTSSDRPTPGSPSQDITIKPLTVVSPHYEMELSNRNGAISSLTLNHYLREIEQKTPLYMYVWNFINGKKEPSTGLKNPDQNVQMVNPAVSEALRPLSFTFAKDKSPVYYETPRMERIDTTATTQYAFTGAHNGVSVRKTVSFNPDSYLLDVTLSLKNTSEAPKTLYPEFIVGSGNEAIASETMPNEKKGLIYYDKSLDDYDTADLRETPINTDRFNWGGVMSRYFIAVVRNPGKNWKAILEPVNSDEVNAAGAVPVFKLERSSFVLPSGETWSRTFQLYMGPKYTVEMDKFDINMVDTLDMNLNFIAQPMLFVLRWAYDLTKNWGVAIIILTLLVRLLIFPLAYKGMSGMQKMSKLTPKVQALKKKYGKNKEKFNREVMDLYKRNKANPMGGCLPLLIQMPIFFALYSALMPAIELRYQPFIFWLHDLSQMDHTLILPILSGSTMFFQQKLTPTPATADPTQVKIMRLFPIMMSVFFAFAASGLVLYWTISGVISILQQVIFNKINAARNLKEVTASKEKN